MPLIKQSDLLGPVLGARPEPIEEIDSPGYFDAIGAAFRTENTIGSSSAENLPFMGDYDGGLETRQTPLDPDYDPIQRARDAGLLQPGETGESLLWVNNDKEFGQWAENRRREQADRDLIESAGASGLAAAFTAGLIDPINLLPIGGTAVKAGVKGVSLLNAGLATAAAGAAGITAQELILQGSQELRSPEESALNVAFGTITAGLIGAGGAKIAESIIGRSVKDVSGALEKDLSAEAVKQSAELQKGFDGLSESVANESTVGAARVRETTLEQETLEREGLIKFLNLNSKTAKLKGLSPTVRTLTSPLKEIRILSQNLIENALYFRKNSEDIATPQAVETLVVSNYEGKFADTVSYSRSQYKAYRQNAPSDQPRLSQGQFHEEVSRALHNGDQHPNPYVQAVARKYRKEIFDPIKKEMIELGEWPVDIRPKNAESYLTTIYNRKKIIDNEVEFKNIIRGEIAERMPRTQQMYETATRGRIKALEGQLRDIKGVDSPTAKFRRMTLQKRLDDAKFDLKQKYNFDSHEELDMHINDIVDDIFNKVTGMTPGRLIDTNITVKGPMKGRTLDININKIFDFIEKDAEFIANRYIRGVGSEVELIKRFGTKDFDIVAQDIIQKVDDMKSGLSSKEAAKLTKRLKEDLDDLQDLWDLVRGTYHMRSNPDNNIVKGFAALRTLNYFRLLGGVTISSLPDMAMPVFVHGIRRTFGDALIPMIRDFKTFKMTAREAKLAGTATELELAGRLQTLAEIGDPYTRRSAFENFVANASNVFSKMNGLVYWNQGMKSISGTITQKRIIDNVLSSGLDKSETKYMNFLGLGPDQRRAIAKMFKEHGKTYNGFRLANTEAWTDPVAVRAYRAALKKDVDRTIVTKAVGDVPLFMNTAAGKTIFQFQSFAMASNQRVLMAGLQRADSATLVGLTGLITMGMAAYAFKTIESGRELSDDPAKWIIEGVDRSGIASVMMWVNNVGEKAGIPGVARLAGAEPASRFAARSGAAGLAGPTFGLVTDAFEVTNAITRGEVSESDVHKIRKFVPMNNLVLIRHLFDAAEEGVKDNFGIKSK